MWAIRSNEWPHKIYQWKLTSRPRIQVSRESGHKHDMSSPLPTPVSFMASPPRQDMYLRVAWTQESTLGSWSLTGSEVFSKILIFSWVTLSLIYPLHMQGSQHFPAPSWFAELSILFCRKRGRDRDARPVAGGPPLLDSLLTTYGNWSGNGVY